MENASKALIIAGAILLSILIIGLGMAVYNNASSSTTSTNLDAQELQAHNSQFLSYQGRQKGSNVRALLTLIRNNNREYADRMVKVTFLDSAPAAKILSTNIAKYTPSDKADNNNYSEYDSKIKDSTTYFVTFTNGENGCIAGVDIHVYSDKDY